MHQGSHLRLSVTYVIDKIDVVTYVFRERERGGKGGGERERERETLREGRREGGRECVLCVQKKRRGDRMYSPQSDGIGRILGAVFAGSFIFLFSFFIPLQNEDLVWILLIHISSGAGWAVDGGRLCATYPKTEIFAQCKHRQVLHQFKARVE
jgi:hypothetical protein